VPLNWAATQNNLGNALQTLGEREAGTARLDEAAEIYRITLSVDWLPPNYIAAMKQGLDKTLQTLSTRKPH